MTNVLKNTPLRRMITANAVSGVGNALIPIAFAIESTRIEQNGWGLSFVLISLWSARFIGALFYKKFSSSQPSIRIIIWAIIVMILAQLILIFWERIDGNSILAMTISAFLYGMGAAFYEPSSFKIIPELAEKSQLKQVNSLLAIMGDALSIVGPIFGASIVIFLGFSVVLWIDVISFIIALFLLFRLKSECKHLFLNHKRKILKKVTSVEKSFESEHNQLPVWVIWGLVSWFFISIGIGFLGVAGPTLVIISYSEKTWVLIAVTVAIGSLLGSTTSLTEILNRFTWPKIHLLCGILFGAKMLALGLNLSIIFLMIFSFLYAALIAISSIQWDTLGQLLFKDKTLHYFASFDQLSSTIGVPVGMLLFAICGWFEIKWQATAVLGVFILIIFIIIFFIMKNPVQSRIKKI